MSKDTFIVDIDGTLCENTDGKNYVDPSPRKNIIAQVNRLYDSGAEVIIFTARGMNTYSGNVYEIEKNLRYITENWLHSNGVKYNKLIFGKPAGDFYVDDKALLPEELTDVGPK